MKRNIAVIWGGYSSEIVISEKSMKGICSFLDKSRYTIYALKIDRNSWTVQLKDKTVDVDKNDFSFIDDAGRKTGIDFAYITIHGTPGEDGKLQGYLDMMGVPYSSCGVLASALTMNKYICNRYLDYFGVQTACSVILKESISYDIRAISEKLKFPLFVKPNLGGSSFATTKVLEEKELQKAIDLAFNESDEVIVESFLEGTEVTCGCYAAVNGIMVLPLTEVVTSNTFFDFDAKYNGQVEEITPARINSKLTEEIQKITLRIYDLIGAKGFIRADYIIREDIPYLLEVNTTPGMTTTSFIPQQIKAAGLDVTEVFTEIIESECNKFNIRNHG